MLNKSALSVAAIVAGLLVSQPVSTAVAGGLSFTFNIGDGLSIHAGSEGVQVDAGIPGAGDPDYDDVDEDTLPDEDIAVDDETVIESAER